MAFFITSPDGTIYELDATETVGYSQSGSLTNFPLADGTIGGDNYQNEKDKVTFSGISSTFKTSSGMLPPEEYLGGLRNLKRSRRPFTVTFSNVLDPLPFCFFKTIDTRQSKDIGDAYEVILEIEQAIPGSGVIFTTVDVSPEISDQEEELSEGPGSTQDANDRPLLIEKVEELDAGSFGLLDEIGIFDALGN